MNENQKVTKAILLALEEFNRGVLPGKIPCIKAVRTAMGINLMEAKILVESLVGTCNCGCGYIHMRRTPEYIRAPGETCDCGDPDC